MAAPILWTPGKHAFFLQADLHVHEIQGYIRGGGILGFGGGGEVPILFLWARGFSELYFVKEGKKETSWTPPYGSKEALCGTFHASPLPSQGLRHCTWKHYIRGPPTTHHPHKRPSSSGAIFGAGGGGVRIVGT